MKLYKQEGKLGLYQLLLPARSLNALMHKYLPESYGDWWFFFKNNYGKGLMQEDRMGRIAKSFFARAKDGFPPGWERQWAALDRKLTEQAARVSALDLQKLSAQELWALYQETLALDLDMWAISIFIDAFDPGYDQPEIEKRKREHKLTDEEVQILLAPEKQSYLADWEQALYDVKTGKRSPERVREQFFWVGADYADFAELDEKTVAAKAKTAEPTHIVSLGQKQKEVLVRHKLANNPLRAFQILAQWRDDRKRLNFTGVYALVRLLREGLRRQKIPPELVNALYQSEPEQVFFGMLERKPLERRLKEGVFVIGREKTDTFEYKEGAAAEQEFNRVLAQWAAEIPHEVKGMVACKGKAQGEVKIILKAESDEAKKMRKGDILVTSMTRPEFVPLMKKAAAIVTDEGGISCHAAIVARELNIPCIIGTKNATKVLKDGDMVEVDAEKGIVRKVNQ